MDEVDDERWLANLQTGVRGNQATKLKATHAMMGNNDDDDIIIIPDTLPHMNRFVVVHIPALVNLFDFVTIDS